MADEANDHEKEDKSAKSLEDFITEHYNKQKEDGKMNATEDIDDKRALDFFSRAMSESRRMNSETVKSEQKLAKLHAELGKEKVAAWQAEHAAEVLTPEQLRHMGLQQTS
ncbi:uncharacterized protein LOC125678864 [Ostrea edulis]|uniref:uncharacterized protein LOC125678864 n=1 Tax=Ostrea edulis TaxID=37623 RepID=UPI0020961A95|nr:uncharacterized protein LOC125678864 [Ostrea edulis]XP_056012907.1 uncharacterized protein LOC125678864 [Ostrea edulis]